MVVQKVDVIRMLKENDLNVSKAVKNTKYSKATFFSYWFKKFNLKIDRVIRDTKTGKIY